MVPFVLAAGATQYPVKKFLFALTLGRAVRYTLLAFLAARYGRNVLALFGRTRNPALYVVAGLIAAGTAILLLVWRGKQHKRLQA